MLVSLALLQPAPAQTAATASDAPLQDSQPGRVVFKMNADLVLTNVVAREAKSGELVQGLKQSDFTVYENGKKQEHIQLRFSERGHGCSAERCDDQRTGRGRQGR